MSTFTGGADVCMDFSETLVKLLFLATPGSTGTLNGSFNSLLGSGTLAFSYSLQAFKMSPVHGKAVIAFKLSGITATKDAITSAPFGGTAIFHVPFKLSPIAGGRQNVQLDFGQVRGGSQFVGLELLAFLEKIGWPIQQQQFLLDVLSNGVRATFRDKLAAMTLQLPSLSNPTPFGFNVTPGQAGVFPPVNGTMTFAALKITSLPESGSQPGVLSILASVRTANVATASATKKDSRALDGPHQVGIAISPTAFHALVFCQQLRQSFGVTTVQDLCATCGNAATCTADDVQFSDFDDDLAVGKVNLTGFGTRDLTLATAEVSFSAHLTFTIAAGGVTPHSKVDDVEVNISMNWWQTILALLNPVGGLFGSTFTAALLSTVMKTIAEQGLTDRLSGLNAIPLGVNGVTFDEVKVHPLAFLLRGNTPLAPT